MKEVLEKIENANDQQINEILDAVVRRYQIAFPGWEVMFISISKDPEKRKRQKWQLLKMIWKYT